MIVYLSKPMIMRTNPFLGISRMRRFRMVDMCKGKRKLWLWGTDNVLVVGLHMVGKRVKVSSLNNVTSLLALYFSFLLLDSSLSSLYCHSSFLFFFFFFHSLILIFFISLLFYTFFLSFPYSYFSLYFSLSWQLFKALNSSLSCMYTIWNFKYTMLETTRNFEGRLCSRNVMYKRDE
jgi:hypothetical protein